MDYLYSKTAVFGAESPEPTRAQRLVIAPCSAGKRCRAPLSASTLPRGPQPAVAQAWQNHLRKERVLQRADRLYKGRAFSTARAAAAAMEADFGVISAGLGYVDAATPVPGYDLTVRAVGPGSVRDRVDGPFDAAAWWRAVSAGPFASDLVSAVAGRDLVLIALSRAYLDLLGDTLQQIANSNATALRLFGLSIDTHVPASLRAYVMPYDARLERLDTPGTRSDFAPRALAHFARRVLPDAEDLSAQRSAVSAAMAQAPTASPQRPQRRADDETLKAVIRRLAPMKGFRSGEVLRALRRDEGWSCEQGRFVSLYRDVRAELEGAHP